MKKTIAIFTGNRAEYGLLYPILREIKKSKKFIIKLLVSGAHLDKNFGTTLKEIKKDGFKIDSVIKIKMDAGNQYSTSKAIGTGIISLRKSLFKLKPDLMVVYADRFEGFAAVITSTQSNIPTIHIEGGDITEGGALDDNVRHAMTKLSHFHMTTNDDAKNRIINMGEEKWRVHNIGFPAIDLIKEKNYAPFKELKKQFQNLEKPTILFTQHSVTMQSNKVKAQIRPSLNALKKLSKDDWNVIITYPNNDAGGKFIIEQINKINLKKFPNIKIYKSLGRYVYHGLLALNLNKKFLVVCAGNSSSGIKETPVFKCPTINIGSRQKGRLRGKNVLDTGYDEHQILSAFKKCIYDKKFILKCKKTHNPYYKGGAGRNFRKIVEKIKIDEKLLIKKMMI